MQHRLQRGDLTQDVGFQGSAYYLPMSLASTDVPPCGAALFGHSKIESTVRHLGMELDAIEIAEKDGHRKARFPSVSGRDRRSSMGRRPTREEWQLLRPTDCLWRTVETERRRRYWPAADVRRDARDDRF